MRHRVKSPAQGLVSHARLYSKIRKKEEENGQLSEKDKNKLNKAIRYISLHAHLVATAIENSRAYLAEDLDIRCPSTKKNFVELVEKCRERFAVMAEERHMRFITKNWRGSFVLPF